MEDFGLFILKPVPAIGHDHKSHRWILHQHSLPDAFDVGQCWRILITPEWGTSGINRVFLSLAKYIPS